MKDWFKQKTHSTRLRLIRLLSPSFYDIGVHRYRPFISYLQDRIRPNQELTGVEIGVASGSNALSILKSLPIKKLYLVDSYEPYHDDSVSVTVHVDCYPHAKKRLRKFKDKTQFILMTSTEALPLVPNNLDFVYVDGNHTYEYVKEDLENYYPKLRRGGILAGHDFCSHYEGVVRAVLEFVDSRKLRLRGEILDYIIEKP